MEDVKKIEHISSADLPGFYHSHESPISIIEMADLYRDCVVRDHFSHFEVTPANAKAILLGRRDLADVVFELPLMGVARDNCKHYLPFERVLRDNVPDLDLFGYAAQLLLARKFGVDEKSGIYPCDIFLGQDKTRIVFGHDLENRIPAYLLFYTESESLYSSVHEKGFLFLDTRIGVHEVFSVAIPMAEAAMMCYCDKDDLLNYLHEVSCAVQETEYRLAKR